VFKAEHTSGDVPGVTFLVPFLRICNIDTRLH